MALVICSPSRHWNWRMRYRQHRGISLGLKSPTMSEHACRRCGLEAHTSRGGWADRHPAAAVTAGLFTLTLTAMMLSEHPVAALAMLAAAGAAWFVWLLDRERDRRAAVAARADWQHRLLTAAPMPPVRQRPHRPGLNIGNDYPTSRRLATPHRRTTAEGGRQRLAR
jgi:hypothetical protein